MNQPNATKTPVAPTFWMHNLAWVAYGMSVGTGALGQILFLGKEFGGETWSYGAAVGLAGFAEVVMSAAGDASLNHRANRRAWKSLLALGLAVACYAASMNLFHFWSENKALATTFGGASLVGFLLHIIDGHIRVAAYLREDDAYRASLHVEAPAPVAPPKPARPRVEQPASNPAPKPAAAPVTTPSPGAAAATTPTPEPTPTNVRELHPELGTKLQRAKAWFMEQVLVHQRDPETVTAAEVDTAIGANGYSKKHIKDWRDEVAAQLATAVND